MKLTMILLLSAVAVGCGYGSKATTPMQAGTKPIISQLTPASANHGAPAFTFEVDGTNFLSTAVINFNGTAMTTTSAGAGKLTTMIPASAVTSAGTVPVTVTNPGTPGGIYGGGTSAATSVAMDFTIN